MAQGAERLQVAISQDFFTAFANIPRAQQRKVNRFVSDFRDNPRSPGINYERINDAAHPGFRSVRIDLEYRGIVLPPEKGNVYLLLWVDKHDAAYDWARRHRCEVNPQTGSLQIFETLQTEPEPESELQPASAQAAPVDAAPAETERDVSQPQQEALFHALRDRELLRLGVPESHLPAIRKLIEPEQLEALASRLPVEAFEALYFLAEGLPLDEVMREYAQPDGTAVDPDDVETALTRPGSQRRFHVVDDELELIQMLEAPLEQWRVFLHPSQRRLVERHWNGPVRVLGGAGTGKTVVAMHRARWLVRHVLAPGERLLLTTFTRNLATDIEASLRKICTSDDMKAIEVINIDAWVVRFLKRERNTVSIVYPGQPGWQRCWDEAMALADTSLGLPETFYAEEFERVVLPQRITTQRGYFKARRAGRGVALTRSQRASIWPVFEEMRFQLHQKGLVTNQDATFLALDLLEQGATVRPYRAAVVDEAQDFGAETLQLVRALVAPAADDLMIVGDGHQRIYGRRAALSHCGINIIGRGRKLRINYRTTEQIRRFATAVLEGVEVDDMDDGADGSADYRSLVDGEKPTLKGFSSTGDEAAWVADEIHRLLDDGIEPRDICVVGRTATQLRPIEQALEQRGVDARRISRDAADSAGTGVRLANMHRIKGLEFRVVFLVGIRDGVVPLERAMSGTEDVTEKRARELNERALLHVAGTRAAHSLYVTWSGEPSRLIHSQAE